MRIGIDARLYGLEHAGLGRYVMRLVQELIKMDKKDQIVLFVRSKYADEFKEYKNVTVRVVNTPIYGVLEQVFLPFIFSREKLDVLHVPHFNAPILYPGKLVITVHDLIKHYSKGRETTTRQPFLYNIKRIGYLILTAWIIRRADAILTPSEYVKNDILRKFKVDGKKIIVTYEAVGSGIEKVDLKEPEKKKLLKKFGLTQPFLVYTGSVYPHKNVDLLIEAVIKHNKNREVDLSVAIICSRSVFYDRMKEKIMRKGAAGYIKMLGFLPDSEVSQIYSLALALVHPSKMEGFGLTGLEAMKAGLPVVSSNASSLPEIYGEAAYYFDPASIDDLISAIEKIKGDRALREKMIELGLGQVKKYSWRKMTKETLKVFREVGKK